MRKEIGAVGMDSDGIGSHVGIHFLFTFLPAIGPEPALIGRYGQRRPQFQYAVVTLGDLHLSARFIQTKAAAYLGGQ